ncbi:UNVERIFIED_CONTAM: hypothetical protein HDU68_010058 [Siphonaria sp. JEL0065]|nr:hypothetical protein HDU68_010058 [Siphonaria sp. JEL0065]
MPTTPSFRYKTLPIRTARESKYMRIMNEILIKPDWWIKIRDKAIVVKWKVEIEKGLTELLAREDDVPGDEPGGEENAEDVGNEEDADEDGEVAEEDVADVDNEEESNEESNEDEEDEDEEESEAEDGDEMEEDDDEDSDGEEEEEDEEEEDTPIPLIEHVSDKQFIAQAVEFVFQELEYIASHQVIAHPNGGKITPTSSHGVFISDWVVPKRVITRLTRHVAAIEEDSLRKNKWHEGSDGKVLDLIHPSDYPLVYGRSKLRIRSNQLVGNKTIHYTNAESGTDADGDSSKGDLSEKFQWLPSEFRISKAGAVSVKSYINNLNHREHLDLFKTIRNVFELMVPMFEMALGSLSTEPPRRIDTSTHNDSYQQQQLDWQLDEFLRHKHGKNVDLEDQDLRNEAQVSDEYDAFQETLWDLPRPIHIPGLPKSFTPPTDSKVHLFNLHGKTVQVIVKMASIRLTPEKPVFNGGSWHLEGMENEAIAATGILYYAMDNITSSRLTFRSVYTESGDQFKYGSLFDHEQSDFAGLEKVFGFSNEVSLNTQICGQIEARQNRVVVFPNFLHHKVEDFELEDKTRNGYRKILAFFVVHPDFKVTSTANVGMQQINFVTQVLFREAGFGKRLPVEVVRRIVEYTGAVFTPKEADAVAHEVMEERKNTPARGYANVQNIFLCEH